MDIMKKKKKIIISGGSGRFGSVIKKFNTIHKIYFPSKNEFNILKTSQMNSYIKKKKTRFGNTSCWSLKANECS